MDVLLLPVFILFLIVLPALFLALLLYAIPVQACASVTYKGERMAEVMVISWSAAGVRVTGFGAGQVIEVLLLDHVILRHTGSLETPNGDTEKKITPGELIGADGAFRTGELIHLVQQVTGPVGTFMSVIWQQSRFTGACGTVTFGLGDPALTGEVYGYYWASRFLLLASRIDIRMQPVFDRAILELDITVQGKVTHPLLVLIAGLDLVRDPSIREVLAQGKPARAGVTGT